MLTSALTDCCVIGVMTCLSVYWLLGERFLGARAGWDAAVGAFSWK